MPASTVTVAMTASEARALLDAIDHPFLNVADPELVWDAYDKITTALAEASENGHDHDHQAQAGGDPASRPDGFRRGRRSVWRLDD